MMMFIQILNISGTSSIRLLQVIYVIELLLYDIEITLQESSDLLFELIVFFSVYSCASS